MTGDVEEKEADHRAKMLKRLAKDIGKRKERSKKQAKKTPKEIREEKQLERVNKLPPGERVTFEEEEKRIRQAKTKARKKMGYTKNLQPGQLDTQSGTKL